ncbi:hypothetical protein STEG23_032717, partial [Scotinomys teguina]
HPEAFPELSEAQLRADLSMRAEKPPLSAEKPRSFTERWARHISASKTRLKG